jgi:GT2 family glycosyltransferase
MKRVTALIPTLGRDLGRLANAVQSVRAHTDSKLFELVVVNNSSGEYAGSMDGVDKVLNPGLNLGYVGALEWVRRMTSAEYLWVLQDDLTLTNDVLGELLSLIESDHSLAVVSPLLVRQGLVPRMTRGGIFTNPERTEWRNIPALDTPIADWSLDQELSFVAGSGALFRSEYLAIVGGFDVDLFPLMHVDVDVCARLIREGYRVALCKDALIAHEVQGSTPSILRGLLDEVNAIIVRRKLGSPEQLASFSPTPVDHDIVTKVAEKASILLVELAMRANAQNRELTAKIQELRQENLDIRNTASWRVTRPLRFVRTEFAKWIGKKHGSNRPFLAGSGRTQNFNGH